MSRRSLARDPEQLRVPGGLSQPQHVLHRVKPRRPAAGPTGGANGAFLRAGLVDELNLIICPTVDGSKGAPSVFDSSEAEARQRAPVSAMTLESSRVMEGGSVLLRYRLKNAASDTLMP